MQKVVRSNVDHQDVCIFIIINTAIVIAAAAPKLFLQLAPPCLFTTLTGHHCWGCGMTRAVLALMQGDLTSALEYNRLAVIVLPLLGIAYVRLLQNIRRKYRLGSN